MNQIEIVPCAISFGRSPMSVDSWYSLPRVLLIWSTSGCWWDKPNDQEREGEGEGER